MEDGEHPTGFSERAGGVTAPQRLHSGPRQRGRDGAVHGPDLLRRVEDQADGDGRAEEVGRDGGGQVPAGLVTQAARGHGVRPRRIGGRSGHGLRRKMNTAHKAPWHAVYDGGACPRLPQTAGDCRTGKQYDKHPYGKCRSG